MKGSRKAKSGIQVAKTFLHENAPESHAKGHTRSLIEDKNKKEVTSEAPECSQGNLTEASM